MGTPQRYFFVINGKKKSKDQESIVLVHRWIPIYKFWWNAKNHYDFYKLLWQSTKLIRRFYIKKRKFVYMHEKINKINLKWLKGYANLIFWVTKRSDTYQIYLWPRIAKKLWKCVTHQLCTAFVSSKATSAMEVSFSRMGLGAICWKIMV